MSLEIERRFLMRGEIPEGEVSHISQAYLSVGPERVVQVLTTEKKAWLTMKGQKPGLKWEDDIGRYSSEPEYLERLEFQYEIPLFDARQMFAHLAIGTPIYKTRVRVPAGGDLTWEINVFYTENEGLVVAQIECESADQEFEKPGWLGDEVTDDARFSNEALSHLPFGSWDEADRSGIGRPKLRPDEMAELSPFHLRLRPLNEFEFSIRTAHLLWNRDIVSVGQLLRRTEKQLLTYSSGPQKSIKEIKERLAEVDPGLKLGDG